MTVQSEWGSRGKRKSSSEGQIPSSRWKAEGEMKMEILSGVFYFGGARLAAFGGSGFYTIMSRYV